MPELPEVETIRRHLEARVAGKRIVRARTLRPDMRAPFPRGLAKSVEGRRVARLDRRAKYLLIHLDDGYALLLHLGMSGRLLLGRASDAPPEPHVHVEFDFDDGTRLRFQDPRRFGRIDRVAQSRLAGHKLLAHLGPEPMAPEFTAQALEAACAGSKSSIKAALLDQRRIAGIGNIYACEALFRAGISPRRKAGTVKGARAQRLAGAIREVLAEALAAGGSTLRDHRLPSGELGYFQHRFAVYDREGKPCPGCDCGGGIRRIVQQGRSTFFCPKRQG